jgi:hypothetical protein
MSNDRGIIKGFGKRELLNYFGGFLDFPDPFRLISNNCRTVFFQTQLYAFPETTPSSAMAATISALPHELCSAIAASTSLGAKDLNSLALVSRAFHAAATEEPLWHALLSRKLQPVIDTFFDGEAPAPADGVSWKRHFFELRASWKARAQQRTGRLLVQVGTQRLSGRKPHELPSAASLLSDPAALPSTYGIYDVTTFVDHHPGIDLREAAAIDDASDWFEMNAHSDAAILRLRSLAVPGLQSLPYDIERPPRGRGRVMGPAPLACALLVAGAFGLCYRLDVLCGAVQCNQEAVETLQQVPAATAVFLVAYVAGVVWTNLLRLRAPAEPPVQKCMPKGKRKRRPTFGD